VKGAKFYLKKEPKEGTLDRQEMHNSVGGNHRKRGYNERLPQEKAQVGNEKMGGGISLGDMVGDVGGQKNACL